MPNRIHLEAAGSTSGCRTTLFTANKAEQTAFKRLWIREASIYGQAVGSYRHFRKQVLYDSMNGCFRYIAGGIYIGIESDGYTHT